ncbi:hypothetical protein RJ640_000871 [Escallonia rubra]|uniref:Wall-associated receptor kinase galacturonan-binding domain-containing protein n=1 Tax=Escallonia rubra TaxID=112253 RepID=A0AA88QSF9_9ASTE|nr:hypothetical protein RJ640_000871 [Escallonia rubra]
MEHRKKPLSPLGSTSNLDDSNPTRAVQAQPGMPSIPVSGSLEDAHVTPTANQLEAQKVLNQVNGTHTDILLNPARSYTAESPHLLNDVASLIESIIDALIAIEIVSIRPQWHRNMSQKLRGFDVNFLPSLALPSLPLYSPNSSVNSMEATASIAKPGCQERCGNLTVPFPFGIGTRCYLDKTFRVICSEDAERVSGSQIFFAIGLSILELSLEYVHVQVGATPNCYSKSETGTLLSSAYGAEQYFSTNYTNGCAALCDTTSPIVELSDATFSGIGCCQSTIPNDIVAFDMQIHSSKTLSRPWTTKPCSIAVLADKNFSGLVINISDTNTWGTVYNIPLVLDWVAGNTSC